MIKLSYQLGLVGAIALSYCGFTGQLTSTIGGIVSVSLAAMYIDKLLNLKDKGENQ